MLNELRERNKARTGHYITYWGAPKDIQVKPYLDEKELAIVMFPPKGERHSSRYVTNGMSEYAQRSPQGIIRTELYACLENRYDRVISLLYALALYPSRQNTYFADYDTIPTGKPIDQKKSVFRAILLAPVHPEDPESLGVIHGVTSELIFIHLVIPIYDAECDLAIRMGGEELWNRLLHSKSSLCLDASRQSIV